MKEYSTDGKVRHLFTEDDIDTKISKIIGKKFVEYRAKWNEANDMSLVTDFLIGCWFWVSTAADDNLVAGIKLVGGIDVLLVLLSALSIDPTEPWDMYNFGELVLWNEVVFSKIVILCILASPNLM